MEKFEYHYSAGAPAAGRAVVGVVGSGDLEVLLEPGSAGLTTVRITTSVDGYGEVWQAQLDRVFKGAPVGPGGRRSRSRSTIRCNTGGGRNAHRPSVRCDRRARGSHS